MAGIVLHVMGFQLPCSNEDRLHALLLRNPALPSEPRDQQCAFPVVQSIWHASAPSQSGKVRESVHCSRFAPLSSVSLLPCNSLCSAWASSLACAYLEEQQPSGKDSEVWLLKSPDRTSSAMKACIRLEVPVQSFVIPVSKLLAKGLFH